MTRTSKELLALALGLGLGLAACNSNPKPPGTPSATFVSPADGATLTADAGIVNACVLTTTVTADTTAIDAGVSGSLTVNGVAAGMSQVVNGTLTFTGVPLNGSDAGTTDVLVITIDGVSYTARVTVVLNCGGTSCVDAGMPTLDFTQPSTPDAGFNLKSTQGAPGLWLTFKLMTNVTSGSVEVCSSAAPPDAGNCGFGSGLFEVGMATVSNTGTAILTKPVGDDGTAGDQVISAQLTSTCGNVSASIPIQAHANQPIIESVAVQNASDAGSGGCQYWLNSSNLNDAGVAQTAVIVTVAGGDLDDGGVVLTITGTADETIPGTLSEGGIPLSLSNGAYNVNAIVTDFWGNQSDAGVQICVKTTLPNCTLSDNYSKSCFNIADNDGGQSNGAVPVILTVTPGNVSATGPTGTIDGTADVTVNGGGSVSEPIDDSAVSVSVSSPQGSNVYSATVTDPAGNPAVACASIPSPLALTVSTEPPTLTVVPQAGGSYSTRDSIPIVVNTTNIPTGSNLQVQIVGAGGSSAQFSATVAADSASLTLSGAPDGPSTVVASGTDQCGNPGSGDAGIDVTATSCDLTFVSPTIPRVTAAGEWLLPFNASEVSALGTAGIYLHTSCPSTQVQFTSTPAGGSAEPQMATADGNGDVMFDLLNLVDGSTGTFSATASGPGGEALPIITYDAKLSLPAVGGETPAAGDLEIVASQDNLILDDAGVTELVTDGGTVIANQAQCAANACADFVLTGISGLGPVDPLSGKVGTATLTADFAGQTTTQMVDIPNAVGLITVPFNSVSLPPVSYPAAGKVTILLTDNYGNTPDAGPTTWNVTTDSLQPPAPNPTAAMLDKRTASVQLNWTVPPTGGDTLTAGYELAYVIDYFDMAAPGTVSEVQYPQQVISAPPHGVWTLDPKIQGTGNNSAVDTPLTYTEGNLPTLNWYTFELRAIDQVGNRSPLVPTVTASSVSTPATPDPLAWQTVTLTDPDASGQSDFGYVLRTGDFNGDAMQDLVVTAPGQYEPSPTPGTVYVMNGAAAANLVNETFAGMTAITLGGTDYDWFGQDAHVAKFNNMKKFDDLAVGSPEWDGGQGRIDIFFGSNTGLPSKPSATIVGDSSQSGLFGYSVSSADVDNDGIPDLIVGAPGMGAQGNGASYLFLGKNGYTTGMDFTSATSVITGNAGDGVGARWGSVDMGDITGDGDEDFTIGAPGGGGTDGFDGGTGTVYGFSGATALANATMTVAANALFTLTPNHDPAFCDPQAFGYASGGGDEAFTFWACFGVNAIGGVNFTGAAGALSNLVVSSDYYSGVYIYTMGAAGPNNVATAPELQDLQDQSAALGWSMAAPDLNLDNHNDLLIGENGTGNNNVLLFLNSGGTFPNYPSGELFGMDEGFGYGIAEADFQNLGNGKKDFAVSDWLTQSVTVYY